MTEVIKFVECPRDAWQGLPGQIPTELKAGYLQKLIQAGFKHIDAVSFVSPKAVPQMADSEQVLDRLTIPDDVEIIGIIVNEHGAERAIGTGVVRTLGFPYSISAEFLRRNQHQTQEQSLDALAAVGAKASQFNVGLIAYLSMSFGNPYGDAWSIDAVVDACGLLADRGVKQISLADTVGIASETKIGETVQAVIASYPHLEIGVHLHARRADAQARIVAAYGAGCRRFDSAIGGHGGCPFAQDALVGNIPTELLIDTLTNSGAQLASLANLNELIRESNEIELRFSTAST
jgi:hydroxymethylglutaryl-CoA lyase